MSAKRVYVIEMSGDGGNSWMVRPRDSAFTRKRDADIFRKALTRNNKAAGRNMKYRVTPYITTRGIL